MKKVNRLLSLTALALATAMLAGACGGVSRGTTAPALSTSAPGELKPVTFKFYQEDGKEDDPWTNEVALEITRLTGVTIDFDYPVGDTNSTRIPLMISSGDYPDYIYVSHPLSALVEAEALVDMTPYIEARGDHIKRMYGELLVRCRYMPEDPSIYVLGSGAIGRQSWSIQSRYPVQIAVLKEFGWPDIKTRDEVVDLISQYAAKYPEIDGMKTIPLSLNAKEYWRIDLGNSANFHLGWPDHGEWYVDETSFEAMLKFMHPEFREHYRWLNGLYNNGLLDPDSFTQSNDDFLAKIASGRVLSVLTSTWVYASALGTLVEDGKNERLYAHLPITKSTDIRSNSTANIGWSGGWGVSITKKCKDIDRAFDFLNWCCTDEAQILKNWGIEGVHYEYDSTGTRVTFPEVKEKMMNDTNYFRIAGVNRYTYPWPQQGNGLKDPTGNTYTTATIEGIMDGYTDAEREALAAYGANIWADLHPPTSAFPQSPFGAAWQVAIPADSVAYIAFNQLMDYIAMALPKTVICGVNDFDAEYDKYIQGMYQYEVDKMNEEFTELVKAKVEFWK